MLMNRLTKYDSCNSLLQRNKINIYDNTNKPGIQQRLLMCPNCNHKHLIIVMDKKARRMMQENKKDRDRIAGIGKRSGKLKQSNQLTGSQAESLQRQTEKLWGDIEKRTAELDEYSKRLMNE